MLPITCGLKTIVSHTFSSFLIIYRGKAVPMRWKQKSFIFFLLVFKYNESILSLLISKTVWEWVFEAYMHEQSYIYLFHLKNFFLSPWNISILFLFLKCNLINCLINSYIQLSTSTTYCAYWWVICTLRFALWAWCPWPEHPISN